MIPILRTDRLTLRGPKPDDFEAFVTFRTSDRAKTVGGPFSRAQAFTQFCTLFGHWEMRGYGRWIVADRDSDEPFGVVGLLFPEGWPEPELAWSLFANGEGRGIAYEATLAARHYAYDTLGMPPLASLVAASNERSVALATRLGAAYEKDVDVTGFGMTPVWRHPGPEVAA